MNTEPVIIGGRKVGPGEPPFIVAEMSGNHGGSLERALAIVEAAARSGAHALKLQTYTPRTMTLDLAEGDFRIRDAKSLWNGYTLHDLYQEAHTPWDWHAPIFRRCGELGLPCFSMPFDATAVEFLESLGNPVYKIASFENGDLPLIRKAAATGKPLVISTGMASLAELEEAVAAARGAGCRGLVLLKCTSAYPAPPELANLRTIPHLAELFGLPVGLSDHSPGIGACLAAVALGAAMIEKHVVLSRAEATVDSAFSLEPAEMRALVEESDRAWRALGTVSYGISESERRSRALRRSLYLVRDLPAGAVLGPEDVRAIRPGAGLAPKHLEALLGRRLRAAARRGTPLSWDLLA